MGAGGRPKKPTALKLLEGNPGHRTIKEEIKPNPIIPDKPKFLKKEASDEWDRISIKLEKLGLLSEIDGAALAGYCQSWRRWIEAERDIDELGMTFTAEKTGYQQQIPQVGIAHNCLKLMSIYIGKFGLSPSDRSGLGKTIQTKDDSTGMAKLLSK